MQTALSKGVRVIMAAEGFHERPYTDEQGNIRFGPGLLSLTRSEAEIIVSRRIADVHGHLRMALPWFDEAPDDVQFAAIAVAYHVGDPAVIINSPAVNVPARAGEWQRTQDAIYGLTTSEHAGRLRSALSA